MASSKTHKRSKRLFQSLKEGMMAPETSFFIPSEKEEFPSKESGKSKRQTSARSSDQSGVLKLLVLVLVAMMVIFLLII